MPSAREPLLDQVFDGDSLYGLRAAVAAHSLQAGLAQARVGDFVVAVHELALTPYVTAPGTDGCRSGNMITPCTAWSPTTARRRQRPPAEPRNNPRMSRYGTAAQATGSGWSAIIQTSSA